MMAYRSDWPEMGACHPFGLASDPSFEKVQPKTKCFLKCANSSEGAYELFATFDGFEAELYRVPFFRIGLEILSSNCSHELLRHAALKAFIDSALPSLISKLKEERAYVYARVVPSEPLSVHLIDAGFEIVEHRCFYVARIEELASRLLPTVDFSARYICLAELPKALHSRYQQEMLDVCVESFEVGNSRHFTDVHLTHRRSGVDYILEVMRLNFKKIQPEGFLLAIDPMTDSLAGFTVVGRKASLRDHIYTQLLSAVRAQYRSSGIYRGLTHLLASTLPRRAMLLNVTHAQNRRMRRAYEGSGRVHFSDGVIVRRFFGES